MIGIVGKSIILEDYSRTGKIVNDDIIIFVKQIII